MEITQRQLEIVEAAGRLLTRLGLSGLTIKNLAKEMHFSEGAIYRHFVSKEDIVLALLQYLSTNVDQRLNALKMSDSSSENLIALLMEQFTFFSNNPHFIVAILSESLMEESSKINQAIINLMNTKLSHIRKIIQSGQEMGEFTNEITDLEIAQIVMGSFKLQIFKWRLANFSYSLPDVGSVMIHSVVKLILN